MMLRTEGDRQDKHIVVQFVTAEERLKEEERVRDAQDVRAADVTGLCKQIRETEHKDA